ncbi:MAG: adenine phosphoribosyltransferase [Pseudomonadota bacterium]
MTRDQFHKAFKAPGPVVLPVIHVLETERALTNIDHVIAAGAPGCFLINHDFGVDRFMPILRNVRLAMPRLWLGANFLAVTGRDAFPTLGALEAEGLPIDAYWADDARIDETGADPREAEEIARIRASSGWSGLYFGGTAFKKQRPVAPEHYEAAARQAVQFMDVVTTSGPATGQEADLTKIADFRRGMGDVPLAVASGVTPANAARYGDVDAFLVATGINHPGNFYDIDPERLEALTATTRAIGQRREDD